MSNDGVSVIAGNGFVITDDEASITIHNDHEVEVNVADSAVAVIAIEVDPVEVDLDAVLIEGPAGMAGPEGLRGPIGPAGPIGSEPELGDLTLLFENRLI